MTRRLAITLAFTTAACSPQATPPNTVPVRTTRPVITEAADQTANLEQAIAAATIVVPHPRARTVSRSRPVSSPSRAATGNLPPIHVKYCESKGDYSAESRTSSASGAWQILDSTWRTEDANGDGVKDSFRGYTHAASAPPDVQDERAAQLWAGGRGSHNWAACL